MNVYAVLMAGGVGTRFWPRSRSRTPKQVLNIVGEKTMIQATVERVNGLVDASNIMVVTNADQKDLIHQQIPSLQDNNFILEPVGRNTAPCIGLAAIHIVHQDPSGVMVVLPADHLVTNVEEFRTVVQKGARFVFENDGLLTLGIEPHYPATGYGYIQRGEPVQELNGHTVYAVKTFAEKPNYETAVRFIESGDFYWNSGMFIWKAATILKEIEEKLPEIYEGLMEIRAAIGTPQYEQTVNDVYERIRGISIDYGVMQSAENVYVIPTDMGWNDVGSWQTVYEISPKDKNENARVSRELIAIDSRGSYVYAPEKLVALVGVNDLVVVDTGDALLICHRDRAQEVRDVVEELKKRGLDEYL